MALSSPRFKTNERLRLAAANNPALRKGHSGLAVRIIQQALIELGHRLPVSTKKYRTPDGEYGTETKEAVREFQRKHSLGRDGVVGKNTMAKLDRLLPNPAPPLPPLPTARPFVVQGVPLIAQDKSLACWYASAQMVIQWRRNRMQMTEINYRDPSQVPGRVSQYIANNGLPYQQVIRYANDLGLRPVPLMTPTQGAIRDWLRTYGPIWAAGQKKIPGAAYGHVMVIVGIRDGGLLIHDPEPVNVGTRKWVDLDWLVTLLEWGTNKKIVANFLHCPTSTLR